MNSLSTDEIISLAAHTIINQESLVPESDAYKHFLNGTVLGIWVCRCDIMNEPIEVLQLKLLKAIKILRSAQKN